MNTAPIDWKEETKKQWNAIPCGTVEGDQENLAYFLAVEKNRYVDYAPWMKGYFQYHRYANKKVLEIGFGQGTDLCQFAQAGADCYGVDITQRHLQLAQRNLQVRNLNAHLYLQDASKLPFEDNTFDIVYSFGVLHHTPDTIRCFSEAYRVLKPSGEFVVGLYHRYSAFHLFSVLLANGLIRGNLKKLGYAGLLSTIEKGADGITVKPLVKLYTPHILKIMLSDFSRISFDIRHLDKSHFSFVQRIVPSALIPYLERTLGWYVIARAIK